MGQNPKKTPKTHSRAYAKSYDLLKNRHCKAHILMPEPKVTNVFVSRSSSQLKLIMQARTCFNRYLCSRTQFSHQGHRAAADYRF